MTSLQRKTRFVKPAVCVSEVLRHPIAPCELLPGGLAGVLVINGTHYSVEVLGYLPEHGEPVVDGYRLTKPNGEAHDLCLVGGRLECTCGDWLWRRSFQNDPELMHCKHCLAVLRHFAPPADQLRQAPTTAGCAVEFDDP
jgi:hypothetical protein